MRLASVIPFKEKDPKKIIILKHKYRLDQLNFSFQKNTFYENLIPLPDHKDIELGKLKEIIYL